MAWLGYFAGVVQAPMTAFGIILEMTGDHGAVIPLMAVSMLGDLTPRILSRGRFGRILAEIVKVLATSRRNGPPIVDLFTKIQ